VVLLLAFPIIVITALILYQSNQGSIWFLQPRPGLRGRIFKVIKFKTMNDQKDSNGNLLPDETRLTVVGKFVRKTSIDELPQFINVLKGDMSMVGPRPLLVEYLPLYSVEQSRRHEVRPGITGWAQVNGRNSVTWKKRLADDVWYVNNISFLLDLKILLMTVTKVLKAEGINSSTAVTMEKFKGNEESK
jgi:undecaprenyl phosphate N,N'-diacetylbacillosamine 1-phosphate transferase